MLNPVQGVKTFEAKHPKAAKVAKVGAAVAATAAVVAGVGYAAYKGKGTDGIAAYVSGYTEAYGKAPSRLTKLAEGLGIAGDKIAEVATNVAGKAKAGASKIAAKFKKETVIDEKTAKEIIENTPLADTSARAAAHFAEANLFA